MDSELVRRKPVNRPHREIIGAAVMEDELFSEAIQGEKSVTGIEVLLILMVAAFNLAVVSGGIGADELVTDTQLGGGGLKQRRYLPPHPL